MTFAPFKAPFFGLRIPAPRAIQGQVQLAFATPMVVLQACVTTPILRWVAPLAPRTEEPLLTAWMAGVLYWSGVNLTVGGRENLDPEARYVFVSNHLSHFDVPCISTALPVPVRFVAKRSLLKVPVFGTAMRAVGTVTIDRENRNDTLRTLREAQQGIGRRRSIHFFPEGTRSPDGRLRHFKKGAAAMALGLQVPLVPLCVTGTRDIYPKGTVKLQPGTAHVEIGRPIPVGPEDSTEERARLTQRAREQIRDMLAARGALVGDDEAESPEAEVSRGS